MHDEPQSSPPGTWFSRKPHQWSRGQSIAALSAIALLAIAGLWTLHPFLPALGWGSILAISLWPVYQRCAARWPGAQKLWLPAGFTLLILLLFVIPLVMVALAILHDSASALQWLSTARMQGVPVPELLHHLPYGEQMAAWWQTALSTPEGISRLSQHASTGAGSHLSDGEKILGGLVRRLLLLSFTLITLFFLLRDGLSVAQAMRIGTRRAFGEAGERVAHQAVQAIRGTVNGLVIVGFGEGLILGVTYGLAGAVHAALLGLLTGLLSAIPMGATVAVALAAGTLAASSQMVAAAIVAVIGFAVVFLADHFVRPVFIGEATRLPFLWVLLGILGGVETWGLIGLVMGPALMAVLMLLWREWVGASKGPLNPVEEKAA
jgi:predicted PurR-regulated permease PerM